MFILAYADISLTYLLAVSAWFEPFFSRFSIISNMTLITQVQHYATLAVQPDVREEAQGPVRYLLPEKLAQFVNTAEWNLGKL
jgi:phosphatidylinositol glycan class S